LSQNFQIHDDIVLLGNDKFFYNLRDN